MVTKLAGLAVALALAAVDASAQPAPDPGAAFLHAADANDYAAMQAVMDPGSAGFLKKVSNCYLRRVYSDAQTHQLLAVWMCAEGPNRSRVVVANIALTPANKVSVSVQLETTNARPAPERAGSAFTP
jgi:hypothetical protein